MTIPLVLLGLTPALFVYAYLGYPAIMALAAGIRKRVLPSANPLQWPELTVVLPVYNEEAALAGALDALLALDYPADRRHILVVSDASSDRTDAIAAGYAGQGVRLLRLPTRTGKTGAENAAFAEVRGTVMVTTDATTRLLPEALKALLRPFADPLVGLASGRDISVDATALRAGQAAAPIEAGAESGYVGYEMWVRDLETRAGSIVGASGCLFAIRTELLDRPVPPALSRDFASALFAVERGYRAVSVSQAACLVPRAKSHQVEFRRKARTMARGLATLWYRRRMLLLPGNLLFSFALISHKLVRWLAFLVAPISLSALGWLAVSETWARWLGAAAVLGFLVGWLAYVWPSGRRMPRLVSMAGFVTGSCLAGFIAWIRLFRGATTPIWEPTRRV